MVILEASPNRECVCATQMVKPEKIAIAWAFLLSPRPSASSSAVATTLCSSFSTKLTGKGCRFLTGLLSPSPWYDTPFNHGVCLMSSTSPTVCTAEVTASRNFEHLVGAIATADLR